MAKITVKQLRDFLEVLDKNGKGDYTIFSPCIKSPTQILSDYVSQAQISDKAKQLRLIPHVMYIDDALEEGYFEVINEKEEPLLVNYNTQEITKIRDNEKVMN